MTNILIPTDFSQKSYQTIEYITKLFKNEPCAFYFLHTYNYGTGGLNAIEMLQADDVMFEKPKEGILKQLGNLLEKYTVNNTNDKHEYYVVPECATLVKGIEKHIETIGVDLMVLKGDNIISKNIKDIVNKIRLCPVLIVPPKVPISTTGNLTIASSFKKEVRTFEIDKFLDTLNNTDFVVNILVLEEKNIMTDTSNKNLKSLISHLDYYCNYPLAIKYIENTNNIKNYATIHLSSIICITDEKPDILRKIGLSKSRVISTLKKLNNNPILTIHQ